MNLRKQRKMTRFDLKLPATVSVSGSAGAELLEFETQDISECGTFLRNGKPLAIETAVDIELVLPLDRLEEIKGNKVKVRLSGVVVRSDAQGIAVRFDEDYVLKSLGV